MKARLFYVSIRKLAQTRLEGCGLPRWPRPRIRKQHSSHRFLSFRMLQSF